MFDSADGSLPACLLILQEDRHPDGRRSRWRSCWEPPEDSFASVIVSAGDMPSSSFPTGSWGHHNLARVLLSWPVIARVIGLSRSVPRVARFRRKI